MDDEELLKRACSGDEEALESLLREAEEMILARTYFFLPDICLSDREDIVQETLLSVRKNLSTFKRKSMLRTWHKTIVFRRCMDFLRDKYRRPCIPLDQVAQPDTPDSDEGHVSIMSHIDRQNYESDEAFRAHAEARLQYVRLYMQKSFNEDDWALADCRIFDDKSDAETAKVLRITVAAVKRKLFKLRNRIKNYVFTKLAEENKSNVNR